MTPIAFATTWCFIDIIEFFIDLPSIGVNILDNKKRTPLHYACETDLPDLVKYLVAKKANINAQDISGLTPMMVAGQFN